MMNLKSLLARPFAGYIYNKIKKGMDTAVEDQESILKHLIKVGKSTSFGKDHGFSSISSYADFVKQVPIRDYEQFKSYIELVKEGRHNILWRGKPIYFAKTSSTTSVVK